MVQHADIDHTGLTGVGGSGGEFTEQSTVKLTSGDLTTTSTTFIDATGLSITMTTAAVRCLVILNVVGRNSTNSNTCVDLNIDGTRVGGDLGLSLISTGDATNTVGPVGFTYLTNVLSAGSHTFKIQWKVALGTGTLFASTTISPAIFQVIETSMAS